MNRSLVGFVGVIVGAMVARIPTAVADVHAAPERDLVVDEHELLVVRARERMARVEAEVHAPMRPPSELHERQQLARLAAA